MKNGLSMQIKHYKPKKGGKPFWAQKGQAPLYDSFQPHGNHLSQIPLPVAINPDKIQFEIWLSPKTAIPLHRRKETIDKVNKKYNH